MRARVSRVYAFTGFAAIAPVWGLCWHHEPDGDGLTDYFAQLGPLVLKWSFGAKHA